MIQEHIDLYRGSQPPPPKKKKKKKKTMNREGEMIMSIKSTKLEYHS